MTMLIDEQLHHSHPGPPGWVPAPEPTGQFPGFVPGPAASLSSAFRYAPTGSGQPGAMPHAGYAPPTVPAPPAASPPAPTHGFSAKLTPGSMLLIVLLAVGGWYYYQHRPKPTPTPPAVTQPTTPPSGQGSSQGTGSGSSQGTGQGTGSGQGSGSGHGSSQGTGSGSSQGTGQGTGSGSGQASLSPADTQLLTHVPAAIQSSCTAYDLQGAQAAVQCTTTDDNGSVAVVYGQFTTDSLDAAFTGEAQGLDFVPVGACTTGQCTYGDDGSANSGQVDYFTTQGVGGPMVGTVWTNTRTSILAIAAQDGTDVSSLVSWWGSDAGPN